MKSNIHGETTGYRGLVGGNIFADLLEPPLGKYRSFIPERERIPAL
jgi:hypothetical protein